MQRRVASGLAVVATIVLLNSSTGAGGEPWQALRRVGRASDAVPARAATDPASVLVQLVGEPLATSPRTRPGPGARIDFASPGAQSLRAELASQRDALRTWMREHAPRAAITAHFDLALNAVAVRLNGTDPAVVTGAPGVRAVQPQTLYHPLAASAVDVSDPAADPDLGLISAKEAWAATARKGEGVEVAVIDTGIDATHPCFAGNKVIVEKVFANQANRHHYTPEAVQDHGTHVAGTIACNEGVQPVVDGVAIPYAMAGVAPQARLGNYNVFPGDVQSARSEDILNALEAAYADGMDVANLSLGGRANGAKDLLTAAIDNLDAANMVVAVAAGNSGPGRRTVESPGSAERALTAGAASVPHFVGATVTDAVTGSSLSRVAAGDFAKVQTDLTAPLSAPVAAGSTTPTTACEPFAADSLTKRIVVVRRGACAFTVKVRNAQTGGAAAVIVVNNVAGDPSAMGTDGTADQPTIPAYMAAKSDEAALVAAAGAAHSATISAAMGYYRTANADIMAGFSSQGPTDVTRRIKPDVVAPGVNVLSSIPHAFCAAPPCFAFFQGTSMATPHLAGSAAVLRSAHPDWTAAQIRSAIVNTADRDVLRDWNAAQPVADVNVVGAGRENLADAARAAVTLDRVSVSFGRVAAGSGSSVTTSVDVTNVGGAAQSLSVAASMPGTTVSPASLSLGAGATATVRLTFASARNAPAGERQGWLDLSSAGVSVAHAALFAEIA